MAGRHSLLAVVLFAVALHVVAITQTILPAQDGLKFIRIARMFHSQPWTDVVRGSDTHPLYPALIAVTEPVVARFAGEGPDAWRLASQLVAVLGSIGLLVPIYCLTRSLFDGRIACMAAALAVLLPRTAELGHDTLSDSTGLMFTFAALWLARDRAGQEQLEVRAGVRPGRRARLPGAARSDSSSLRDRFDLADRSLSRLPGTHGCEQARARGAASIARWP